MPIKILVVGCGAIGKWHAVNAAAMSETAVVDANPFLSEEVSQTTGSIDFGNDLISALKWGCDGVVVAVPNSSHITIAKQAIESGADVLIEKPLSHDLSAAEEFMSYADSLKKQVFVVCNMRFHLAVQELKNHLPKVGRPLFARAHFGNYLPDMRPGADYRKLYVANREEGGVTLDGIHEIDYLSWLLGPVESIVADTGKISRLEINAEDYASLQMRHVGGIRTELHLDYVRKAKRRGCEIVGEDGILDWVSEGKTPEVCRVRLYLTKHGWQDLKYAEINDKRETLRVMMNAFVEELNGRKTQLHTGHEAIRTLKVAYVSRKGERIVHPI